MKKQWEQPEIIEIYIADTLKTPNGNHYGWNNVHNPHYVPTDEIFADTIS